MNQKNPTENTCLCPQKKTSIGGQALMEGIMMRGPKVTAMAVRNPQGEIVLEKFPTSTAKRPWPWRVPVIRGVFNFVDTMVFGYKCLMRSAEISGLEEAEEELAKEKAAKKAAKQAKKNKKNESGMAISPCDSSAELQGDAESASATAQYETAVSEADNVPVTEETTSAEKKKDSSTGAMMIGITVVSIIIAAVLMVGLFVYLPVWIYSLISPHVSWMDGNRYVESVFCGLLKVILLVGYMSAISLMKDIRRTFQFHGAEHKTIFCYEAGLDLTVENVRKMRRFHPRCGTSFLILMVLVSIFVGFFIPPALPTLVKTGIRLLLVPVICGLGYELIKFCGRHDNWLTRIIAAPGLALQRITVFEPDDSMIECAIVAMKEVIPNDDSDNW